MTDTSVAARDELAGVVDLFGALTHEELRDALGELAFKRGVDADEAALSAAVAEAVHEYYLVPVDPEGTPSTADDAALSDDTLLAVGPAAFPTLPPSAEDLPHILDVEDREVDRAALGTRVRDRLADETDTAVTGDEVDAERLEELLDVVYDLEAWAPVDADDLRARILDALDDEG